MAGPGFAATSADILPPELRKRLGDASILPLWEVPITEILRRAQERPQIWRWSVVRSLLEDVAKLCDPSLVERRVLSLISAKSTWAGEDMTTGVMNAAYQMLLPGERARPHRHPMSALRFIIEGNGARTIVDGKPCAMEPGDLILTPGWTWHQHEHLGHAPAIWVDLLDVALHRAIGTEAFEPGPVHDLPQRDADAAFAVAGMVPVLAEGWDRAYSPMFRYPWSEAVNALKAAPQARDGAKTVRYANPITGGSCLELLDCYVKELEAGRETIASRSSASAICTAVEGEGVSRIGDDEVSWKPNDTFTIPQKCWTTHRASAGRARLFITTNREAYRRLGLLKEEFRS